MQSQQFGAAGWRPGEIQIEASRVASPTVGIGVCPLCSMDIKQEEVASAALKKTTAALEMQLKERTPFIQQKQQGSDGRENAKATYYIYSYLLRYKERIGSGEAVYSAASIALHLHVLDSKSSILSTFSYDQTQREHQGDQMQEEAVFIASGKWLTADELLEIGVAKSIEALLREVKGQH